MPDLRLVAPVVRRGFARAARKFDEAAVLHREAGQRLFERLQYMQLDPALVVDLGAGTGNCARLLEKHYPHAHVLALDFTPAMLHEARRARRRWFSRCHFAAAEATRLPLRDGVVDLVFSNLMLPWCSELSAVFAESARVLRPGGLLLFSTLGPGTLQELRAAWSDIDRHAHVRFQPDMHDVGDALVRASFAAPVMDRENLCMTYRAFDALLRDLKDTGARNSLVERRRGLTSRGVFATLAASYERHRRHGVLPATFELVFGHAWKALPGARPQDGSTVATFPFKHLARRTP